MVFTKFSLNFHRYSVSSMFSVQLFGTIYGHKRIYKGPQPEGMRALEGIVTDTVY